MPRVKGGATTRRRRKKILKLAKGYFGSKRTLYRTANEQVMRSLAYAYKDRKRRKRDFRKLWITRINAAAQLNGMKYSKFIHGLSLANVHVNRKMLADIAVNYPEDFKAYCTLAQKALKGEFKPETVAAPKKAKTVEKAPEKKAPKETKVIEAPEVKAPKETKVVEAPEVKAPKASKAEVKKEAVDYSKLLVKDLKELAKEKGVENYSTMLKADLVDALTNLDK